MTTHSTFSFSRLIPCVLASLATLGMPQASANWWMSSNSTPVYPPTPQAAITRVTYLKALPPAPQGYGHESAGSLSAPAVVNSAVGVVPQWLPYTANNTLAQAMTHLSESAEGQASLSLIQRNHGKVMFKNLGELNPQYADYDALAWMDGEGNWLLFINELHANAPSYALAALISHEAMHADAYNSKQEEAEAWNREAQVWEQFRALHPELNNPALERYALVKRLNRIAVAQQRQQLTAMVKQHPSYAHLPETSPMFSNVSLNVASTAPAPSSYSYSTAPVPQEVASTMPGYSYSQPAPPTYPTVQGYPAPQVQYPPKRTNPNDIYKFPPIKTTTPVVNTPAQTAYAPTEPPQPSHNSLNQFRDLKKPLPDELATAPPLTGLRLKPVPYRVDAYHAAASTVSFNWSSVQVPTP